MTDERRRGQQAIDPAVDAAWRTASVDSPPAQVDDAILAAARAEATARAPVHKAVSRQPWWTGWQPLAAAAGVAGLAFMLVQVIPRDAAPSLPQPELPAATAPAPAVAPAMTEKSVAARQSAANDAAAATTAERPASAGVPPPVAAEAVAAPPPPEAWARRIAALHAAGDHATAAAELRAFRVACPDADDHLPQSLRAWAAAVPGTESP